MRASSSQTNFLCVVCFREYSNCAHQGEADVKRHILTKTHKDKASSLRQQHSMLSILFVPQNDPLTFKIFMAEVLMTNFIVENNVLIATANKYGPLLRNNHICPQIRKLQNYQCVKTKTVCILNRALIPRFHIDLVYKMKANPCTKFIATCRSNDSDLTKNKSLDRKNR